jgi:serine/threonine-protein kinase
MLIGKILLKRYQIVEEIGSGAFGHTYKAIDAAFPGKPHCVVKHLSPHNDDSKALEIATRLFETEAKVLSRLGEHDKIPRLFSYFEEDGEFFLVQELIKGQTLSKEFQSGRRWSEEETVNFLRELLEILSVVHQENTIHRDLKPANIMRRDSDGKLVLIDFGAVKEVLTVDRDGQTDSTIAIGTLTYMPFEQTKGKPGKHSDVKIILLARLPLKLPVLKMVVVVSLLPSRITSIWF